MAEVDTVTNGVKTKEESEAVDTKAEKLKKEVIAAGDKPKTESEQNDAKMEVISDLERKIINQVEYYFGDINLPRDRFLQEQIKLDDGWIPLVVMVKFNRLAQLSTDFDVISGALKKSTTGLIEVSGQKIRRSPDKPLPVYDEDRRKELINRTLYCKGFPVEGTTLDMLLEYFEEHGPVDSVQMRYWFNKEEKKSVFKGSVFVFFKTKALAEVFMKRESMKYNDAELIRKWQADYFTDKKNERLRKKMDKKKTKQGQEQKEEKGEDDEEEEEEEEEEEKDDSLPKGATLHLSGFNAETTREDIRAKLMEYQADIAFIDFNKGDSEGWIRLNEGNTAKPLLEKATSDGRLEICGSEIKGDVLAGEEEEVYLKNQKEDIDMKRSKRKQHRGKGKSRGRKGFRGGVWDFRGKKRKEGSSGDGPPAKRK